MNDTPDEREKKCTAAWSALVAEITEVEDLSRRQMFYAGYMARAEEEDLPQQRDELTGVGERERKRSGREHHTP